MVLAIIWWLNYGHSPNNAYLIDKDGTIFSKHGWFNQQGHDIKCDIIELLYGNNDCEEPENTGNFEFSLNSDVLGTGLPEETIFVYGELNNYSDNPVEIEVRRLEENLPMGWATSICLDVCYPPDVDSTTFVLGSGETQAYTMYFYTNNILGQGMVKMSFQNLLHKENLYTQDMYAETQFTTSIEIEKNIIIDLFPNPTADIIHLNFDEKFLNVSSPTYVFIYNSIGTEVLKIQLREPNQKIDLSSFDNGNYYCYVKNEQFIINKSFLILK